MTTLIVRCAWCGKDTGTKDGKGTEGHTDGICKPCLLKNFPDIYQKIYGDIIQPCGAK